MALMSVIGFILCEGFALTSICKSLGYKGKKDASFIYSSADIYFSNITPSASGGQPASAYFMYKDGIPTTVITVSLIYNLLMYSISIIIVNIIAFLFNPFIFLKFGLVSKILIILGFLCQFGLIALFYCLLYKDKFLYKIVSFFLRVLSKFKVVSNVSEKLKRLDDAMDKYKEASQMLKGKRVVLIKALLFNIFQRLFQIGVIIFVFLASHGMINNILSIFAIESLVILGSYCVPVPGGVGVVDYLMFDGFKKIMPVNKAINLEILSRTLSFYCCIIICGIAILVKYIVIKRNSSRE